MIRVVFVDDEPNILNGLKRMLRPMRKEWRMEFFDNGADALESIQNERCDVIVSDMRMPKMDGVQLLTSVRENSPGAIRIALSGQSGSNMIYRCIKNAHQYLAKPCSADQLLDTVTRVGALQQLVADDKVRSRIAEIESVPTLPESYSSLINELEQDDPSMKKVAELIETDVAVSAKMLQIVNSAYFGLPRQISSSHEAVMFLGIDSIKNIVLANGVFSQFDPDTVVELGLNTVWSHGLAVGTLAKKIALDFDDDKMTADFALMGGLLSGIGTLVMAMDNPSELARTLKMVEETGSSKWSVETELLGYSYMEIGACLASMWGLPSVIVEAIGYQHRPSQCSAQEFTPLTAIHIADSILRDSDSDDSQAIDMAYINRLNLADRIEAWRSMAVDQ
ncbi:MAG: HDOD domain-containing protein [Gammaproteobacteria bacterium]